MYALIILWNSLTMPCRINVLSTLIPELSTFIENIDR